jgi:hypothetical protein
MKLTITLVVALASAAHAEAPEASLLRRAPVFSSFVGDEPCLSRDGSAFLRLLHRGAADEFKTLARVGKPAGQLYALCGLEALRAPEASALRKRLSTSALRTGLQYGCVRQNAELKSFFRRFPDGTPTDFDQVCRSLTTIQESSKVVVCGERREPATP